MGWLMATSSGHDEGEFGSKPFLKNHRELLRNQFASAALKLDEAASALEAAQTSGNARDILCARQTWRLASEHEQWQEDLQKALDHDHVIFVKGSATQLTKEQIGWNLELIQEETHDARRATVAAWPPWSRLGPSGSRNMVAVGTNMPGKHRLRLPQRRQHQARGPTAPTAPQTSRTSAPYSSLGTRASHQHLGVGTPRLQQLVNRALLTGERGGRRRQQPEPRQAQTQTLEAGAPR